MEKINVTIRHETLGNLVSEFKRHNAWGAVEEVFSSIKKGSWCVAIVSDNGETEKIKTTRQFRDYVIKRYSDQSCKKLVAKCTSKSP